MEEFLLRVFRATSFDHCDSLFWRTDGEYAPLSIFVMCNDVFDWATADVEKLTVENIDVFEKALCDVAALDGKSYEGPALFCARVRGRRPQKPYYRDMDTKIAALFDACGPERDD